MVAMSLLLSERLRTLGQRAGSLHPQVLFACCVGPLTRPPLLLKLPGKFRVHHIS